MPAATCCARTPPRRAAGRAGWRSEKISAHLRGDDGQRGSALLATRAASIPWASCARRWLDLLRGRAAFGGSTITMQLARCSSRTRGRCAGKVYEAGARRADGARADEGRDPRAVPEPRLLRQRRLGGGSRRAFLLRQAGGRAVAGRGAFLAVLPRGPEAYDPFRHSRPPRRRRPHPRPDAGRPASSRAAARDIAERTPLVLRRGPPGASRAALRRIRAGARSTPASGPAPP